MDLNWKAREYWKNCLYQAKNELKMNFYINNVIFKNFIFYADFFNEKKQNFGSYVKMQ